MISSTRRGLLALGGGLLASTSVAEASPAGAAFPFDPNARADDEAYWSKVATLYDKPEGDIVQLENGQFGAMSRPVLEAYEENTRMVNRQTTLYTRGPGFAVDAAKVP